MSNRRQKQIAESERVRPDPILLLLLAMIAAADGCGKGDGFDYVRVSGRVTYEDGSLIPAEQLTITFLPQSPPLDKKTHPRPGTAQVNVADGTFDSVTSHRFGDGIVRGRHKVLVEAFDSNLKPSRTVPPHYRDPAKTPLEVDAADSPFDLKIRRR